MNTTIARKFMMAVTACFAMAAVQLPASAAFIEGEISFGGSFVPTGGTDGLADATGISFGFAFVIEATDDLSSAMGMLATFQNFDFNPASTPVTPLWSAAGFSFDLLNVNVDSQDVVDGMFLNLSGSGIVMGAGFEDTAGVWTFSANNAGGQLFSFSSITGAQVVSEPSVLLLLGLGILGLAVARKRNS